MDIQFRKSHFEVTFDDLDFTRYAIESIHLNKLSKYGVVTMYANDESIKWLNSLQKAQPSNMKYVIYSPDGQYKNVIYDGGVIIDDVIYDCTYLKSDDPNRLLTVNIEFTTSDRQVLNS